MTQAAAAVSRHSSRVPPRQAVPTSRDARGNVLGRSRSPQWQISSSPAGWGDGRESRARAAPTDRPRTGEPFGSAVGPARRIGVARSSQRRSRTGNNANEAQLSSSAGCGTARIALKRRADGPPAPPARLPALRTFPRGCRPTRAALEGGAGGGSCVRSRTSSLERHACCCYFAFGGQICLST